MAIDSRRFEIADSQGSKKATDDLAFGETWAWGQILSTSISQASLRVGLGIIAAGFAIAGSNLISARPGDGVGTAMLIASAFSLSWFAISALACTIRGR